MNSCLYKCHITHFRNEKLKRFFRYNYFMFFIDLDEIELISRKIPIFSHNKPNIYSLKDTDYFIYDKPGIKNNILQYLKSKGIVNKNLKIKLLTNVSTFGYNFNPVSFYFVFDAKDNPLCVVPEVGNTFDELKLFFIDENKLVEDTFKDKQQKNFYVSPFLKHDNIFEFNLKIPGSNLFININDFKNDKKIFTATLKGEKLELSFKNLLKMTFLFPLVTLKIIFTIHWQALLLLLKKIKYFKKEEYPELQKGMVLKWKKR